MIEKTNMKQIFAIKNEILKLHALFVLEAKNVLFQNGYFSSAFY